VYTFYNRLNTNKAKSFVDHHMRTEIEHLQMMEKIVPLKQRTKLLPIWKILGFSLGFLPACLGPIPLYWTIYGVESFVEEHYKRQINRLLEEGDIFPDLRVLLEACCEDEVSHKNEAYESLMMYSKPRGSLESINDCNFFVKSWLFIVNKGSQVAVYFSKMI